MPAGVAEFGSSRGGGRRLLEAAVAEQIVACATPGCQAERHAPSADRAKWQGMHAQGKGPTGHSHSVRSTAAVLGALANILRRNCGKGADGGAGPRDIMHRAGLALPTVAGSDRPRGQQVFSEEAWVAAWNKMCGGRTLSWKSGSAGIRWLTEENISAVGADGRGWLLVAGSALPAAWVANSSFNDIESHRPEVPSAPCLAWDPTAALQEHAEALQPRWVATEGFVQRGKADGAVHHPKDC